MAASSGTVSSTFTILCFCLRLHGNGYSLIGFPIFTVASEHDFDNAVFYIHVLREVQLPECRVA